jgi:hypothetical protein
MSLSLAAHAQDHPRGKTFVGAGDDGAIPGTFVIIIVEMVFAIHAANPPTPCRGFILTGAKPQQFPAPKILSLRLHHPCPAHSGLKYLLFFFIRLKHL